MSSSGEIRRSLRRIKADQRTSTLTRRCRDELLFAADLVSLPKVLLDTTVYIDQLQDRLPIKLETLLISANVWHSTVTECELAVLVGLLNPNHPASGHAIEDVISSLEQRRHDRILTPDRQTWREAGMLAGLMARLQQYGKSDQRRALNDALILLSAAKAGLTVLTRNVGDYDLMMQRAPQGSAIFYEV